MKLRSSFLALFTAVFVSFAHAAPQEESTPREPARLFEPKSLSVTTLPNGVRSVMHENPGGDLVSIQVWVRAGSRYESRSNNGITRLVETLALRSSKNFPDSARGPSGPQEALEAFGGNVSSLTSRDSMFYNATVAAPFLPNALRVLADAVLNPDLSDARVEEAKQELLASLEASDPIRGAADLAYFAAFPNHPYRLPVNGTPAGVASLTGKKVREYHRERFAGSNISVVVVGDVARSTGHKLVAQYFGAAAKAAAEPAVAEAKPLNSIVRESQRGALPVSVLTLGFRSPPVRSEPDVIAADVLLAHWKEGREAALRTLLQGASGLGDEMEEEPEEEAGEEEEDIGDEQFPPELERPEEAPAVPDEEEVEEGEAPLALGFEAEYLTQRDSGLFLITLIAPTDRNAAINAVLREITRVQEQGLTADELARAKKMLKQQYIQQSETITGQAGALGFYEMIDDYQFAVRYLDSINRVTNEDIQRTAKEYFKTDAHVQVMIEGLRLSPPQRPDTGTITARRF